MQTENLVFNPVWPQLGRSAHNISRYSPRVHQLCIMAQRQWLQPHVTFHLSFKIRGVSCGQFVRRSGSNRVKRWICLRHQNSFGKLGPACWFETAGVSVYPPKYRLLCKKFYISLDEWGIKFMWPWLCFLLMAIYTRATLSHRPLVARLMFCSQILHINKADFTLSFFFIKNKCRQQYQKSLTHITASD